MNKFRILSAAAMLAAGIGTFAGTSSAHAAAPHSNSLPVPSHLAVLGASGSDPTGICESGGNGCWRDTGSTYIWPRDIAGDTHQQFLVTYWGQAPGADSGACSDLSGVGVFTFVSPADGYKFIGAGYFNTDIYYVGDQVANNSYANWAWYPSGVLVNCGDTAAHGGHAFLLESGAFYSQLYTEYATTGVQWAQIHV